MLYDKDIREPLFMYFEEKYGKTRVFEEKRMGNSRADILIITEKDFIGIEIKSDADTYARLSGQVKDYDRYCDYNYVVAGSTHGTHIGEHVPEYWGIITVEETEKGVDFYPIEHILSTFSRLISALLRSNRGNFKRIISCYWWYKTEG